MSFKWIKIKFKCFRIKWNYYRIYSVWMLTSGALAAAFWTTRNILVTNSMTWQVCRMRSPFHLLAEGADPATLDGSWWAVLLWWNCKQPDCKLCTLAVEQSNYKFFWKKEAGFKKARDKFKFKFSSAKNHKIHFWKFKLNLNFSFLEYLEIIWNVELKIIFLSKI